MTAPPPVTIPPPVVEWMDCPDCFGHGELDPIAWQACDDPRLHDPQPCGWCDTTGQVPR